MATSTDEFKQLESAKLRQKAVNKRRLLDKLALVTVTAGGVGIILSIIAILFFIGIETIPLWQKPNTELLSTFTAKTSPGISEANNNILLVGTEEYREIAFLLDKKGDAIFVNINDGSLISEKPLLTEEEGTVSSTYILDTNRDYVIGTDKGWVVPFEIKYNVTFNEQKENIREIEPQLIEYDPIKVTDNSISKFAFRKGEFDESSVTAFVTGTNQFKIHNIQVSEDEFSGQSESIVNTVDLTSSIDPAKIRAIEVDNFLNNLYVGTSDGKIFHWNIKDKDEPILTEEINATGNENVGVSSLGFLIGSRSLVVGTTNGEVSVWFPTKNKEGVALLTKVHSLPKMSGEVTGFAKSIRDRGFVVNDKEGNVSVYHATTGTQQVKFKGEGNNFTSISFSPRSDGVVAVDAGMGGGVEPAPRQGKTLDGR